MSQSLDAANEAEDMVIEVASASAVAVNLLLEAVAGIVVAEIDGLRRTRTQDCVAVVDRYETLAMMMGVQAAALHANW